MPDLGWWQQERERDQDAGLDWLEELTEATVRLVEDDERRYGRYVPRALTDEEEAA